MTVELNHFLERLSASGLLSEQEFGEVAEQCDADDGDTNRLANELVRQRRLTEYQAAVLAEGTSDPLLLDEYVILREVGAGGMGRVFLAEHRRMKRSVAVKILPQSKTTSVEMARRFRREVEAAARLSHPNIVTAFDAREANGVHFLVMEYVPGADLRSLVLRKGPLGVIATVDCMIHAARGLEYAHSQSVVHRDIKPSNLLIDPDGNVKILDMGLARIKSEPRGDETVEPDLTESGAIMGTIDYMSPEQAVDTKQADERSDIYSLGCTLYFLLTGKPALTGNTTGRKLQALLTTGGEDLPSLRETRQDVPPSLEAVHRKMTARDPEQRFQSMSEVLAALEKCREEAALDDATQEFQLSSLTASAGRSSDQAAVAGDTDIDDAATIPSGTAIKKPTWRSRRSITAVAVGLALCLLAIVGLPALFDGGENPPAPQAPPQDPLPLVGQQPPEDSGQPAALAGLFSKQQAADAQQQWAGQIGGAIKVANSIGIAFVLVPPGSMQIDDNPPSHLDAPLYFGVYEVTRSQYEQIMNFGAPSADPADTRAVDSVTWLQAVDFCNRLSKQEGLQPCYAVEGEDVSVSEGDGYRLPSESEWEYACRAGIQGKYGFDEANSKLDEHGWSVANSKLAVHPVGELLPNQFGLHDMHGNVWEWCQDAQGALRPARGGGWSDSPVECHAAARKLLRATDRGRNGGFRIVCGATPNFLATIQGQDLQRAGR